VPWRIAFRTGSTYDLWNESPKPKFHMQFGGEGVLRSKTEQRVDGRSSTSFMGLDASGASDQVVVTWHRREDLSDEQQRWSGNKPAKR
jgi:hypothetical protein